VRRENTQVVPLGKMNVGGHNPIWVEAMGRQHPKNVERCLAEITLAQEAGCEIFRLAVPDEDALQGLARMKPHLDIPLIADVHFRLDLGIQAALLGVEAIRINPGTIGKKEHLAQLVEVLRSWNTTLRLGANTGSLPPRWKKTDRVKALLESLREIVHFFEQKGVTKIILSAKSTEIEETILIYEQLSTSFPYPLHIGLTEAGSGVEGIIKSSIALGILLREGIGNNIRVSLTASTPILETKVAWSILESLKLRHRNIEIISCPTCARKRGNVVSLVQELKKRTKHMEIKKPVKIAIMGCEVNGPGEAKEADWGIALSKGEKAVLFAKGEIVTVVSQKEALTKLLERAIPSIIE